MGSHVAPGWPSMYHIERLSIEQLLTTLPTPEATGLKNALQKKRTLSPTTRNTKEGQSTIKTSLASHPWRKVRIH
ncbi:rCG46732 [Rattus norvegicus]|uniref:RCG46732 n=1 Tax=Rattus norvegicus TaxID=10116 RepID=A6IX79_RAT|nr:rCG46732 [Rattus norvegicus]